MTICFNPNSKNIGCSIISMVNDNIERFKEASKISLLKTKLLPREQYLADNEDNIFIKL